MGVIKYDSKVRDCGCDAWHFYLIRACYIILERVSLSLSLSLSLVCVVQWEFLYAI